MVDIAWRAARLDDALQIAEFFRDLARVTPLGLEADPTDVDSRMRWPRLDLRQDTRLAADTAGRILAYLEAADMGVGQGAFRVRLTTALRPGLAANVTRWAHEWLLEQAARLHRERSPDLPGVMGARCAIGDHKQLAMLAAAGFQVAHRRIELVRPLDVPVVPVRTPAGITIRPYETRYDRAAWLAHNDASADAPLALLPDANAWPRHAVGLPSFLPSASLLAIADDGPGPEEVIGLLLSLQSGDGAGVRRGVLRCLGTRRPWRRRGVATALVSWALAAYREAGFDEATVEVNDSNPDAITLYARHGLEESGRGYAVLTAPMA